MDPASLLARCTHLFDVSDREEIEATQQTLGRTKAVDRMLYKIIKSQRVELYHEFYGALEMQQRIGKGQLFYSETMLRMCFDKTVIFFTYLCPNLANKS